MSKTMRMFQQLSTSLLNMQRARVKAIDYVMIRGAIFLRAGAQGAQPDSASDLWAHRP